MRAEPCTTAGQTPEAGTSTVPASGDALAASRIDATPACNDGGVTEPIDLLSRPVYDMGQVDRILGLSGGTARRWIDGYERGGRHYPPLVRESPTGDEIVTWGEFVETRLVSEFRDAGVPLVRMRPAVERLRDELQTPYPLASARTWLSHDGRELVRRIQDEVGLDRRLQLVIVRSGQGLLDWSENALGFKDSAEWQQGGPDPQVVRLQPRVDIKQVVLDPLVSSGEPTLRGRGVRTEIIAELVRAGETPDSIAETYELPRADVDAAVRYELLRSHAA